MAESLGRSNNAAGCEGQKSDDMKEAMENRTQHDQQTSNFWAITSYFNPTNSKRRLSNFRRFRRSLNIPLIAVEWAWTEGPGYQLNPDDAEILVRTSGPDLIWQKERLLNVAINLLPAECKYVAWLDCDVFFDDSNWHQLVARTLDDVPLVQPYSTLINLDENYTPIPLGVVGGGERYPLGDKSRWSDMPIDFLKHEFSGLPIACGYAWAARADLLRKHGLYDACVIGSGDRAIMYAAIGCFDEAAAYLNMGELRRKHYMNWALPFFDDIKGRTGWVPGTMQNMWHGPIAERQYKKRHLDFEKFNYDPYVDVEVSEGGSWRWASPKVEMHKYLVDYFFSRREN